MDQNLFEIIPAIDILAGKCVRLTQGDYSEVEEYSSNPEEVAKKWQEMGANRLHIVDLDGAKDGHPVNKKIIEKIIKATKVKIQVGGGIRTLESIKEYLEYGVSFVILGTKAFQDKDFLNKTLKLYKEKIILGLDMKNGRIALSGWNKLIETNFNKLAENFSEVRQIIFTDVSKDGMLTGPNIGSVKQIASTLKSNIIVSGGISCTNDIISILKLKKTHPNISGAILGKSLYKGAINLTSAIDIAKNYIN